MTAHAELTAAPKEMPVRSEPYRRWIAKLPCHECGKMGSTQAAHADFGKGLQTKSSDLTCYPLCVACHINIGSRGVYTKTERREFEERAAASACKSLIALSQNTGAEAAKLRALLVKLGLVR